MRPAPLIGLAVGDALGMPFETQPPDSPALLSWDGSYGSSAYHGLGPGQWTDDTQMSVALAKALWDDHGYDPHTVSDAYRAWFLSGDCRGIGGSTRRAMKSLQSGAGWLESGVDEATGNGTAMRATPIGMWYRNPANIEWVATMDAMITHRSLDAIDGSKAVALAVRFLLQGGTRDQLGQNLLGHLPPRALHTRIANLGSPIGPIIPYVVDTVAAAIWCFIATNSFTDAVQTAVRLGGDTDSVAAITGALAGTHYGYDGIPTRYLDQLEGLAELRDLESRLLLR